MPFRRLLESLIRSTPGVEAAMLLDALGEVVIEAGGAGHRHRLIGAYQGIGLTAARRTLSRHNGGAVREIVCRYAGGSVILRPLKDGYYLVISLAAEASIARATYRAENVHERIDREI